MKRIARLAIVRAVIGDRAKGRFRVGDAVFPCALGPGGIVRSKREGDGATPRARLVMRRLWRRPDRGPRPPTGLPVRTTRRTDAWCDEPSHRRYNLPVSLPFSGSHEAMWRDDGLYDLVVELGWNDRPPQPGRGSAIFLHAARPGFTPTAGCVALAPAVLRRLVARFRRGSLLDVGQAPRKLPLTIPRAGRRR